MDFFLRNEDEKLAENATHLDDVDMVASKHHVGPWGASLVVVAVKHKQHVCWRCGGHFDLEQRDLKPIEVREGFALILLHERCTNGQRLTSARSMPDILRGLQARRFMAKATRGVAQAGATPVAADSPLIMIPK